MSWSGGNKRWTASFKSLNNTTCRIDIYESGYTGTFVQSVPAADNPFFYEEDEDSDILNTVLRYRTGYIRLIEEYESGSSFSLDSIYPTQTFDRYLEVYYGTTLVFNGYIQLQNFDDKLVPVPKVIELPIISPLGLMEQKIFTGILPPSSLTLGQLLGTALSGNYTNVYLPKNYGYPNPVSLNMKILSTVVSPWNKDFHYTDNQGSQYRVIKGESYAFLIEAICKAFGWVAHDLPGALLFTAFDYSGVYYYFPVAHIGESGYSTDSDIPTTAELLEDYYDPADAAPVETTILPDTGIEIEYEGESDTFEFEFDFSRMYLPEQDAIVTMPSEASEPDEINSICNLLPVPLLQEISIVTTLTFDNNDLLNIGNGCCAWNGKVGVMMSMGLYPSGHEMFWMRFYIKKRVNQRYRLTYNMIGRQSGNLLQLDFSGSDVDQDYIYYTIDASNDDYVKVRFCYQWGSEHPQLTSKAVIFISDIKLEVFEDGEPYAEYRYKPASDGEIIPETFNPQPAVSSSVNMPISLYRNNDHLIGQTVRTTKVTTYPYLFQPRKHQTARFKVVQLADFYHAMLFSYRNKNWRIIAQRFDPWNDEITLTMENCALLDTQNE